MKDSIHGLTKEEVKKSKMVNGTNTLGSGNKNTFIKMFIESLGDPIIKILLIALAVKTVFLFQNFDWFETLGIVIAILLASLISTISEYGSEKAFEKMQEETSKIKCKIKREGKLYEIFIDDIVKDDIVLLTAGDIVPADARIIVGELSLDESSFTGESREVYKYRNNLIYKGSTVVSGNAYVQITNIGINTKYGKIAMELLNKNPDSPLKIRLKNLAIVISKIGYTGAFLVFFSYLFSVILISNNFNFQIIKQIITTPYVIFGHIIYALTLAVTIIIVSVPEGLPMMIALVLSSNMKKMIKNNVLVRRMVGIETAGALNTLFTDKTGTITKGNLQVVGIILDQNKTIHNLSEMQNKGISKYVLEGLICTNEASLGENGNIIGGNVTDRAILEFVKSYRVRCKILKLEEFTSQKKFASALIEDDKRHTIYKGAPEVLLPKINEYYTENGEKKRIDKSIIHENIKKYTTNGFRVLIIADKTKEYSDFLTLVGVIVLKDEIRENALAAVKSIREAGIHTVMITGDAKETALNIGYEVGLISDKNDIAITSSELNNLTEDELIRIYPHLKIVARALPEDKSKLVKLAQKLGETVGMTGDGVNDASALKIADVGFSMGSGSEIAKEASDIIILDNDLSSISKAILYGRTIFKSIRKFIIFQLTMNISALSLSILGPFLNIKTPVTVMQMLWINMIMDTLAGLAFSFEPALKEYMIEKPIKKDESIINGYMISSIIMTGFYTTALLILFLKLPLFKELFREDFHNKYLMTAFFGLFVFSGVMNAFNARTQKINIFSSIGKNIPFILIIASVFVVQLALLYMGGSTFRTYGLTLKELVIVLLLSLSVIPIDILRKVIIKKTKLCDKTI